jgi:hypothetical protein
MEQPTKFDIFIAYPLDRDGRVAELNVRHDGVVDIPAEVYRDGDQTMVTLFSRREGPAWTYPVADFVAAIHAAVSAIDAPPSGPQATP